MSLGRALRTELIIRHVRRRRRRNLAVGLGLARPAHGSHRVGVVGQAGSRFKK
jgi:hypothetical protein